MSSRLERVSLRASREDPLRLKSLEAGATVSGGDMASDESIEKDIESNNRIMQAKINEMKYAYAFCGVGLVLLIIGWASYSSGPLGILALVGVVSMFIGVVAYFTTKSEITSCQHKIDELRAVQRDRRQR